MFNSLILFLYSSFIFMSGPRQIEKNGMTFSWQLNGDFMECKVTSPGPGWIAVGFNETNNIVKSNLIMGAAEKGHFNMSDRFVVAFGQHKSVLSLGAYEAISNREVADTQAGTVMTFKIKRVSTDNYHFTLTEGKEIYLWLAYSLHDNFDHHSVMRASVKVML